MIFSISRHKKSFSEKEKSNMEPLVFNTSIAKKKPSNSDECPFCHLDQLTNIIDNNDGLLWLDNKYNTIENTYQTLIIEAEDHYGDISNYSYAYNRRVINYIIKSFLKLSNQSRFKSVAMFKNYGPLSGGSLINIEDSLGTRRVLSNLSYELTLMHFSQFHQGYEVVGILQSLRQK